MMDVHSFGTMARAVLIQWADNHVPELAPFFPFRRVVRFKSYFGAPFSVAITDEGHGAVPMDVGGEVHANDPEVAEILKAATHVSGSPPSFDEMYAALGARYYSMTRFAYVGPYRGGNEQYDLFIAFLRDWVQKCVLPKLLENNRLRVMQALPGGASFDTKTIGQSVVVLESTTDQSTAFALDGVGYISNYHSVQADTRAFLSQDRSKMFDVKVIASNATIDLAVIEIASLTIPALALGQSDALRELDGLLVVGFPNHNFQDTPFFCSGNVSGFRMRSSIRRIMTTAPIVTGMSGGPVLDKSSKVIGVATTGTSTFVSGSSSEDHSVIPIEALNFLRT